MPDIPATGIDSRVNPPALVFHYTGPEGIAGILKDGLIRASPTPLYRDLAFSDLIRQTEPVVWLSINPIMEMTTLVKLSIDHPNPIETVFRVALPYGYAGDLGLGEYTEAKGIPHQDWLWSIRTGEMAGSNYTTWRVCPRDIPRADWVAVERLASFDKDLGFLWEAYP